MKQLRANHGYVTFDSMAKKLRGKPKKKKSIKRLQNVSIVQQPTKTRWQKLIKWSSSIVGILTFLGVIITIIIAIPELRNLFISEQNIHKEKNWAEGDLKSPRMLNQKNRLEQIDSFSSHVPVFAELPIVDNFPKIKGLLLKKSPDSDGVFISVGKVLNVLTYDQLSSGFPLGLSSHNDCDSSMVMLYWRDGRLYISLEFRDLRDDGTLLGAIEYNHWRVFKGKQILWREDDYHLEVKDTNGKIVCSVSTADGRVEVAGYFITRNSVLILGNNPGRHLDTCFSKDDPKWKEKTEERLDSIQTAF